MTFSKDVMFSSATEEWATPQNIFDTLNRQFNFTLDPCATPENAKCELYFTKKENGLAQSWIGHNVFMNPPYGTFIARWIKKTWLSAHKADTVVVCLLPARTDTKWFHEYCVHGEIWFVKGRLRFGKQKNSAPFPSMVVIFPKFRDKQKVRSQSMQRTQPETGAEV